jgi:pimeloyl-ACP methyl ester carboxylesterase
MKCQIKIGVYLVIIVACISGPNHSAFAQTESEGQSVSINGMDMYYEIHGQGEPLLLLHGFFLSGKQWSPFVEELAAEFQLVVPDLRGHGRSTNPGKEFTHGQSARDIFALLDYLGIETVKGMGISSGGMTLLHMATQQRDRVESMVLVGSTIYFPDEARAIMDHASFESRNDPAWAFVHNFNTRGDEQLQMLFSQFHGFKDSYDDMNFTPPLLSSVKARTLIIQGDHDVFFPVSIAMETHAAIQNSHLWIVPNGGHAPIFGDASPEFLRTSKAFLNNAFVRQFLSRE